MTAWNDCERRRRGADLLVRHCAALADSTGAGPSAFERLADALGTDLARTLVDGLAVRDPRVAA